MKFANEWLGWACDNKEQAVRCFYTASGETAFV